MTYVQFCVESDIQAPICRDFWIWNIIVAFGVGMMLFVLVGKRIIKEQLEFYRNRKRLEARKIVADEETMRQHKWVGDDSENVEVTQEDLAAKIRKAIK